MSRFSLRPLLWWLPSAGMGTLSAQGRPPNESAVTIDSVVVSSRHLESAPLVRIFLPPGYSPRATYPVLVANDGQDMEAMKLAPAIEDLLAAGMIEPLIVVAVHSDGDRLHHYGTSGVTNAQGLGRAAGEYERFLLEELMPLIRRRYPVAGGPAAIMGASLGGLSAFDLAWRRSEYFDRVGVFSGAFWWRTDDGSVATKQTSRIMHRRVRETRKAPRLKAWLEAGTDDELADRDENGVIDAIQDTQELIDEMKRKGMEAERDVTYVEVEGGHNPETWARVLPGFLRWAFAYRRAGD